MKLPFYLSQKSKAVVLGLFLSSSLFSVNAQVANYTFSTNTSGTYADLSSPTNVFGSDVDDAASEVINIGFTFYLDNKCYSQFSFSSNGLVALGGSRVSSQFSNTGAPSVYPAIMPFWDDLHTGNNGSVGYQLTGTSPNRVLSIEWKAIHFNDRGYYDEDLEEWIYYDHDRSFQVKLYETSNKIEFIYGPESRTSNVLSATVGLSTSSTDFQSVTTSNHSNSNSSINNANSNWPGINRAYVFTTNVIPEIGGIQRNPSNISVCINNNTMFSIDTSGAVDSFLWQVNMGSGWLDISNSNNDTLVLTGVTSGMNNYQYRCNIIKFPGCLQATSTAATLTVYANPTISAITSSRNPVINGYAPFSCANLTATASGTGTLQYAWSPTGSTTHLGNPLSVCPTTNTTYTLTVTDGNNCQNTASFDQNVTQATSPYPGRVIMCSRSRRVDIYPNDVPKHLNIGATFGLCNTSRKRQEDLNHLAFDDIYNIYPNPAQSEINIEWFNAFDEHVNISLMDMTGRVVKVLFDQDVFENEISLINQNLNDMPNGMYLIRYNSDTQYKVDKLQIVR